MDNTQTPKPKKKKNKVIDLLKKISEKSAEVFSDSIRSGELYNELKRKSEDEDNGK